MNSKEFLTELYRGVPEDKVTYLFTLPGGATYAKSIKGFVSRGWFDSFTDSDGKKRSQFQCKINGVNMRVFRCKISVGPEHHCHDNPFDEDSILQ